MLNIVLITALCLNVLFILTYTCLIYRFFRHQTNISQQDLTNAQSWPSLAVIVPIHNEARQLKKAITHLCEQTYENLEIIAINDRSTDESATILSNAAQRYKQLRVVTIDHLPKGWLGKTHALHCGVKQTNADYYLFTDGDVMFKSGILEQAIHHVKKEKIEHLTLIPKTIVNNVWLKLLIPLQVLGIYSVLKPWAMQDTNPKHTIGLGAFNLLSKKAYTTIHGFKHVALNPLDDIGVAIEIKKKGLKQDCVTAGDKVQVEWYEKLHDFYHGFEKNTYAAFDYQPLKAIATLCLNALSIFLPFIALFFLRGNLLILPLLNITALLCLMMFISRQCGINVGYVFIYPLTTVISLAITIRNLIVPICQKGLNWGGVFFSFRELKRFKQHVDDQYSLECLKTDLNQE